MMGGKIPQHPAQHQSHHLARQATEVGKGVGWENLPTCWVTELLVNVDDEGAFLESLCASVCPITQLYIRPHQLGAVLIINFV